MRARDFINAVAAKYQMSDEDRERLQRIAPAQRALIALHDFKNIEDDDEEESIKQSMIVGAPDPEV